MRFYLSDVDLCYYGREEFVLSRHHLMTTLLCSTENPYISY